MVGSIGGPLLINTIGGTAIVNFGGALFVSPKNVAKTANGSGGGNTAVLNFSITGPTSTNTILTDFIDQPVAFDN